MIPTLNERICYIRLQSLSSYANKIPKILRIIEKESKVALNMIMVEESTYIHIPMQNVKLKSLTWTTKLCRQILQSRLDSGVSYIVQGDSNFVTEKHSAFTIV